MRTIEFTLGDHLRKAREAAGYSQADMAGLLGVHRNTISAWEADHYGRRGPNRVLLREWMEVCGFDPACLVDLSSPCDTDHETPLAA